MLSNPDHPQRQAARRALQIQNPRPTMLPLQAALLAALLALFGACSDSDDAIDDGGVNADVGVDAADDTGADNTDTGLDDAGGDDVIDITADTGPPFDYCTPGMPPDEACFAAQRGPDSEAIMLAVAIADKVLEDHDPTELFWDWGEAVLMIGLRQVYRVTGDVRYLDFIQAWMDHHIREGYRINSSDTCAPAALAVALIDAGRDADTYTPVVEDALRYLREEALRIPEGGLSHFGTIEILGITLWADSLFMFGNVYTSWGEYTDDAQPLDEYAEQFGIFSDLMQEEPGFFRHAADKYTMDPFNQDDGIYWARANGWITAAAYDHLRVRRDRGEALPEMEANAAALAQAVVDAQDAETGLWWNIINRPDEIYLETSASALFAFGLTRGWRYGLLGDAVLPTIHAAMEGVRGAIDTDEQGRPVITGISGPTSVGTFDYYAQIYQSEDISYGVGAVLLALTETSGLPSAPQE